MRVLDEVNNLRVCLSEFENRKIVIVTAFISGVRELVLEMSRKGNELTLLLGTMNAFSPPDFIEWCASDIAQGVHLLVDFRYANSLHWKLYLVEPNIVIVGSANFTSRGVGLMYDTCLVIEDNGLYSTYMDKVSHFRDMPDVVSATDKVEFGRRMLEYRRQHRQSQSGFLRACSRANNKMSIEEFLQDESYQRVPLFVWERDHTAEEKKEASIILQELNEVDAEGAIVLRDFFVWRGKLKDLPYFENDVVLCGSRGGGHIDFYTFDYFVQRREDVFILSFGRARIKRPFKLGDVIDKLKPQMKGWVNKHELTRDEILALL